MVTYNINANPGDSITLRLDIDNFRQRGLFLRGTELALVDADSTPIEIGQEVDDFGYILRTYQLTGKAPYKLIFQPQRSANPSGLVDGSIPHSGYKLTLKRGDDLRFERGTLIPGQTVQDRFDQDAGTKRVVYQINMPADKDITLRLESPNGQFFLPLHGQQRIVDATGAILSPTASSFDRNARLVSYRLTGTAPYRFIMDISGDYAVTLLEGDLIQADLGKLDYDETTDGSIKDPQVIAAYTIDGKEGDLISIQVDAPGRLVSGFLTNAERRFVPPDNVAFGQGTSVFVYKLSGPGPYPLRIYPGSTPFKITLKGATNGADLLTAQLGQLMVNPQSSDPKFKPEVVTNRLNAPARFASYTFDGKPGDLVTLDLKSMGTDKPLEPVIQNKDGADLSPQIAVPVQSNLLSVYQLDGQGPYRLIFETTNQYSVTLTQGDIVRADVGQLPTGLQDKPYNNELPKPAIVAVHQLDVAPNQLVTIQIKNNNRQVDLQIRNGDGWLLQPEARDFQNGDNVYVYIMAGSGPYTASFVVNGKYEASVLTGNLRRLDAGQIPFNQAKDGQLSDPGRISTYVIDGRRNQLITIQLQADGQGAVGDFRDANGKQWSPRFVFKRNNQTYSVYELSGPAPYNVTFAGKKYTILVASGNVLRTELGDVPFEQDITNTLGAPAVTAVYNVPGQPGELVSFQLQDQGRAVASELYDADNKLLKRDTLVTKNNTAISVYTLSGKAPYRYEFLTQGPYKLRVTKGNVLRSELGVLPTGRQVINTLPSPAENAVYTIDGQEGQIVTIELQSGGRPLGSKLTNGKDTELKPDLKLDRNNFTYTVLTLTGPAPYVLEFATTQEYRITVSRGNVVRSLVSVVRFDTPETNTLKAPAFLAVHTIDAQPGQMVSIKLQDNGRPIDSQVYDADGVLLQPIGKAVANNATYTIYTLSGPAPYTISFLPQGQYNISLTRGSAFDQDQGVIPFGAKVSSQVKPPAIRAVYTLVTSPGQVISVQVVTKGQPEFVKAELRAANGKVIDPQSRLFDGTNSATYVYLLTGDGPYQFSFETVQPYDITFMRGDLSKTRFDIYPTPTMIPTPSTVGAK